LLTKNRPVYVDVSIKVAEPGKCVVETDVTWSTDKKQPEVELEKKKKELETNRIN
jgi:hypothetical protein